LPPNLQEACLFRNLAELANLVRQPFGVATPTVFRGAYDVDGAFFGTALAHRLYADDAFRVGEFTPGHNRMHLVLDERLVPPSKCQSFEDAEAFVNRGATRVYHSLQRHLDGAVAMCQTVADAVQEPVHVNAYWSMPLTQHYPLVANPETAFVVQLNGTKAWPIFKPLATDVNDAAHMCWTCTTGKAQVVAPPETADHMFMLTPGDVLVLPRGYRQYAIAGEEGSLHLSFCILHPEIGTEIITRQHAVHPS
jgi:hypothetical protein